MNVYFSILNAFGPPRFKVTFLSISFQEGRELAEKVPDDAGLPDAVHRHHLLLLGHLLQGPPEQEERPATHEVSLVSNTG